MRPEVGVRKGETGGEKRGREKNGVREWERERGVRGGQTDRPRYLGKADESGTQEESSYAAELRDQWGREYSSIHESCLSVQEDKESRAPPHTHWEEHALV